MDVTTLDASLAFEYVSEVSGGSNRAQRLIDVDARVSGKPLATQRLYRDVEGTQIARASDRLQIRFNQVPLLERTMIASEDPVHEIDRHPGRDEIGDRVVSQESRPVIGNRAGLSEGGHEEVIRLPG